LLDSFFILCDDKYSH